MRTPKWAIDLTTKVTTKRGADYPKLTFRKLGQAYRYSGTTYGNREKGIVVRFGHTIPLWERKMVLLHELSHWLLPAQEGHSPIFWKLAFELYKENGIPMRKAIQDEKGYRKSAVNGYREVKGLKTIPTRTRHARASLKELNKLQYDYLGIALNIHKAWAVTGVSHSEERWRGIVITRKLYRQLRDEGWKVIYEPGMKQLHI